MAKPTEHINQVINILLEVSEDVPFHWETLNTDYKTWEGNMITKIIDSALKFSEGRLKEHISNLTPKKKNNRFYVSRTSD